jgi:hypothetical protein
MAEELADELGIHIPLGTTGKIAGTSIWLSEM